MSRSSSSCSVNGARRGPVKLGNMELAHPPGHIFWKKKPKVDKLSLYLERVAGEKGADVSQLDGAFDDKAQRVVGRLYNVLFSEDLMFIKMFDMPPKDFAVRDLYLKRVSEKEYECRLFLRRFVDQEAFQLLFGVHSDVPPGMAVYRESPRLTAEQKAFLEDEWAPVMDGEGFMSPAKMYPWFAMGIANAVTIIKEGNSDTDNGNGEENENEQSGDFAGIEVAGDFPVVRLLFPPDGDTEDRNSDDVTLSIANSSRSQECDETFDTETPQDHDGREPGNRAKETTPVANSETPRNAKKSPATPTTPTRPNAAHYKQGGRGDLSNRSNPQNNGPDAGYGPVTIWSSESEEVISCEQDMAEIPLMITIRPAIRGYGLPPSVKLQHALPKQKPYCEKGLECLKDIQNKLEDGQSLWYLEANPIEHNSNVQKSARFQSMFRKIGRGTKFWSLSLSPIEDIIKSHTLKAYALHEFPIDLDVVKTSLRVIRGGQGWTCVTDRLIDTAILNVVKHNMLSMRGEGECCLKVLQYLQAVVKSCSCPCFLLPNFNIASKMSPQEAQWVASDIQRVAKEIERDPGYVMTFIGYNRRADDSDASLLY